MIKSLKLMINFLLIWKLKLEYNLLTLFIEDVESLVWYWGDRVGYIKVFGILKTMSECAGRPYETDWYRRAKEQNDIQCKTDIKWQRETNNSNIICRVIDSAYVWSSNWLLPLWKRSSKLFRKENRLSGNSGDKIK